MVFAVGAAVLFHGFFYGFPVFLVPGFEARLFIWLLCGVRGVVAVLADELLSGVVEFYLAHWDFALAGTAYDWGCLVFVYFHSYSIGGSII